MSGSINGQSTGNNMDNALAGDVNLSTINPSSDNSLQQALNNPINNISLDNSISVGTVANSNVPTPSVNDDTSDTAGATTKQKGKISLPIVILIIIIVVSVGIIILKRDVLVEFFQTLMKKWYSYRKCFYEILL